MRDAIDSANLSLSGLTTTILMTPGCEIQVTSQLPDIRKPIVIRGFGSRLWRDDSEKAPRFRFFFVNAETSLELQNLTLEGGEGPAGSNGSGADVDDSAGPGGQGGTAAPSRATAP